MSQGTAAPFANACPIHGRAYPCPVCTSGPHMVPLPPQTFVKPATEAWEYSLIRIALALESIANSLAPKEDDGG